MKLSTQAQSAVIVSPTRKTRQVPYQRPVIDLVGDYLSLIGKRRRAATIQNYTAHLVRFGAWLKKNGATLSGQVSPELIREYGELYTGLERSGQYKASTVNNHLNPVRGFLKWMIAEGVVFERTPEGLPWITETRVTQWLPDVPDTSRPTRKERALSAKEVKRLLKAINDPRDFALFALMAGSGLRVSECCALRAADIQIRPDGAGIVHVLDGKGGKQRAVVISASVVGHLYAWSLKANLRLGDTTDKRSLWTTRRGEAPGHISRIRVYQLLQDYAKAAGINRKISPHNLRHTYGTERYREERDAVAVADALGHSGLDYVQTYVKSVESGEAKPFAPEWEK